MKKIVIILSYLFFISCSNSDNETITTNQVPFETFKFTVAEDYENFNDLYSQEYFLNENGKVYSETFTNIINPQHNYVSTFIYNDEGKVISEHKNGQLFRYIKWNGNFAELFNNQNQKISDFTFENDNLIEYNFVFSDGTIETYNYSYDVNNNVIAIARQNEIYVEYLNYDITLINPMNTIKSIGILRLYYNPLFKNFFETEKAYPYVGDDFLTPLTFYNYHKVLDINNRITSITDDKTAIYKTKFEYD